MATKKAGEEGGPLRLRFTAKGAGPFRGKAAIDFYAGVNVLVAKNNAFKSWLLRQLVLFSKLRLQVGDLTTHDNDSGTVGIVSVSGLGLECTMSSRAGRIPDRDGTAPPIEGLPDPISVLVNPNRKDPDSAFRSRLKALMDWVGVEATQENLRAVLGTTPEVESLYGQSVSPKGDVVATTGKGDLPILPGGDLLEIAERIRVAIFSRRRAAETKASVEQGAVESLRGQRRAYVDDSGVDEETLSSCTTDPDAAAIELTAANLHHVKITGAREAALQEQGRRAEAEAALGDRPSPATVERLRDAAKGRLDGLKKTAKERETEVQRLATELEVAKARYQESQVAETAGVQELATAEARVVETQQAVRSWDETKKRLSEPLDMPTEEEARVAEESFIEVADSLKRAKSATKYREVSANMESHREAAEQLAATVASMEAEAQNVWVRLAGQVNQVMEGSKLRVGAQDQSIEIRVGDRWFDIADVDHVGEGVRFFACYETMLLRRKQTTVVVEGSTPVDPEHLQLLGVLARGRSIVLILERQTVLGEDVETRKVEVYGGDAPESHDIEYEIPDE